MAPRGVAGAALAVPPVDVIADGVPLAVTPVTVTNPLPAETLTARLLFETSSSFVFLHPDSLDTIAVVPASAMIATDAQRIIVDSDAADDSHGRSTSHTTPLTTTAFTLPVELPAIRFDVSDAAVTASWSTQPAYDMVDLMVDEFTSTQNLQDDLLVSASYLAATGDASATLDTAIPGFQPAWRLDPLHEYTRELFGFTSRSDGADGAYVFEDVNVGTVRARSDRARPAGSGRARSRRTGS